ncbi:uncharacterized protein ACA1_287630 [Acanthamoeba castellanii str. Neff]|uniref:DUF4386 domain-containing protein n=1 Tax=Acanthamoeba castellanii (strain ATCC 30010 / Neff) TaxID=1257118 RepID=L8HHK9_ACACF|nr:uncharacterized protein ACA1_287630 [Acanthamoeba castellanii str. Neff]ELR25064.1 hypothetical protein ACA1_287630 [Acanthamoeba castellanii str. Neff]
MVRIVGGSYAAWIAMLLLWVPSVIAVFLYFGWTTDTYPSYDATLYQSRGLLFALYSIMCVKKIFKHSPGLAKNLMVYAFVAATILPIFEFLKDMGAYEEAYNLAEEVKDYEAGHEVNYSALEISFRMTQAQSIWIFSSIYLAVGLALLCASYLFWRKPDFPSKGHAYLGIVIAIIGFLSFAFEIASFFNEDLLVVFGVTTLFWGVVAFPLWLLWLGTRLHRVAAIEVIAGQRTAPVHDDDDLDLDIDANMRA